MPARRVPPGLYIIDRFLQFTADRARDRNGDLVPIRGLDVLARANALGVAYTLGPHRSPYLTVAASVPFARASVNSDDPVVAVDRFGLGDAYVQPIKIGWRAPTMTSSPRTRSSRRRESSSRNQARASAGATGRISSRSAARCFRTRRARGERRRSVDYEINQRKRGIDITRGDMLDVQGGAGATVFRTVVVGVAGYGLWQVRNDRGSDVPPALAGARTRAYGLGPEIDVTAPKLGLRAELRYEWDISVRSRPQGQVLSAGLSYRARSK